MRSAVDDPLVFFNLCLLGNLENIVLNSNSNGLIFLV